MKRREFITLLGGAAAAWPLAARAQQAERMRRIGVLMTIAANDPEAQARIGAFRAGTAGWAGPTAVMCGSTSAGRRRRAHSHIRGGIGRACVGRHPGIGHGGRGAMQAGDPHHSNRVRAVPDPVGAGFVDSLARPGGNVTGFTLYEYGMSGKWLELLKEIVPRVTRAAVIRDPTTTGGVGQFAAIQSMAPSLGVEVIPVNVRDPGEIERAITALCALREWRADRDWERGWRRIHRELISTLAARHKLPAVYRHRASSSPPAA